MTAFVPMSHLPAAALTYEAVVTEYFLGLRGAGLMLSPLDAELVRRWERQGIPVAVVCAGLRAGVADARRDRAPDASLPRSLRAYRRSVEAAWRAHRAARVGSAPEPPDERCAAEARLAAARAWLDAALCGASGALRAGYVAAAEALHPPRARRLSCAEPSGAPDELLAVALLLAAADAAMLRAWIRALAPAERRALGPRCRLLAGARSPRTRRAAYRDALRAHLADAAREAGLLPLRGSV